LSNFEHRRFTVLQLGLVHWRNWVTASPIHDTAIREFFARTRYSINQFRVSLSIE